MKRICVFCSSSDRVPPTYLDAAAAFGELLAGQGQTVIYGGAAVGMMGRLANAALENQGTVVGVIPKTIYDRVGHRGLSETIVVDSMHERKATMYTKADGFVALPGGLGTMEELFEILTWQQLGHHQKPCGLLNVNGYFDSLLEFMGGMVEERFLLPAHRELLIVRNSPSDLIAAFKSYQPSATDKWTG